MAILDDILDRLETIINWQNEVVTNSKTTDELDEMTVIDRDGLFRVALGVTSSKKLSIQALIDEIASELALGNVPARFRHVAIDHNAPGSTHAKMRDAINALPNYPLQQGTLYFFYNNRIVLTNGDGFGGIAVDTTDPDPAMFAVISEYYVLTQKIDPDGEGDISVGVDGTPIIPSGIRYFHTLDNRSFETTEFDLGNIGNNPIHLSVDAAGPFSTPNAATILFRALQGTVGNEVERVWLYIGDAEQVGLGEDPTDITDYRLFPDPDDTDPPVVYPETVPQYISFTALNVTLRLNNHEGWFYYMAAPFYQAIFKTRELKVGGFARALITTAGETAYPVIENKWLIRIKLPTGTATVTIGTDNYLATWDTDVQTTMDNFVTAHAADILTNNQLSIKVNENSMLELDGVVSPVITAATTTGSLLLLVQTIPAVHLYSSDFEPDELYDMFVEYDSVQINYYFKKRGLSQIIEDGEGLSILDAENFINTNGFSTFGSATLGVNNGNLLLGTTVNGQTNHGIVFDNYITDLEKYTITIDFKIINAPTANSYGLALGLVGQALAKYEHLAQFSMTTLGAERGRIVMTNKNNGSELVLFDSSIEGNLLSFSQNDRIRMQFKQHKKTISLTVYNLTTKESLSGYYQYPMPTPIMHNIGKFAIYTMGGSYEIERIKIDSVVNKRPELIIVADSKADYTADSPDSTFVAQLQRKYKKVVKLSGGSERTEHVLLRIHELINLSPKIVLLAVGSNDKRDGESADDWFVDYSNVVSQLESVGIVVYHTILFNENGVDFSDYNLKLTQNYAENKILDAGVISLAADNIHPRQEGHNEIFNAIDHFIGGILAPKSTIKSSPLNEPEGAININNIVSISQSKYEAGVKLINTLYITPGKIYLGDVLISDVGGATPPTPGIYGGSSVYSFQKLFTNWDKAIMKVRRNSDNQEKYLFISTDGIIENFLIGDDSTTPSATTFSSWYGSDSVFIKEHIAQIDTNLVDSNLILSQSNNSLQPRLVNSGVVVKEGGDPTIDWTTGNTYLESLSANPILNSGNDYSVHWVTHNLDAGQLGSFFANDTGSSLSLYNSRHSTVLRIAIRASSILTFSPSMDTDTQKIQSVSVSSGTIKSYLDGVLTDTQPESGAYNNTKILLGRRFDANYFNGGSKALIISPKNTDSDVLEIHNDIISKY